MNAGLDNLISFNFIGGNEDLESSDSSLSIETSEVIETPDSDVDDSIDINEFREILSKADDDEFNSRLLSSLADEEGTAYQNLIAKYRDFNNKINDEQLKTILENEAVHEELRGLYTTQSNTELDITSCAHRLGCAGR